MSQEKREGHRQNTSYTSCTKKLVQGANLKQMKKRLQEVEEKCRILLEEINEAIIVIQDKLIKFVNPRASQLSGYSEEELLSSPFVKFIHPDDREMVMERYLKILKGEKALPVYPLRVIDKKGKVRWAELDVALTSWEGSPSVAVFIRDVTKRKKAEERLTRERNLFQQLTDNIPDSICFKDRDGRFVRVNKAKAEHHKVAPRDMIGKTDFDFLPREEAKKIFEDDRWVMASGRPIINKVEKHTYADGKEYWFSVTKLPRYNQEGKIVGTMSISRDITEQRKREEELSYMATHDILTGLPNRALFNDRLSVPIAWAQRKRQKFPVMLFDLDNFKDVNDNLGHSVGDKLLQATADRLRSILRKSDTLARMGGDEFLLLLPDISKIEDVTQVAEKILKAFQNPFAINEHRLNITASIGVAIYPEHGENKDVLIAHADRAMYEAKRAGRNCYRFYKPGMGTGPSY